MRDIDPTRMDELLDGALPETDAERELLHMAAHLRAAAPEAPASLRERVESLPRHETAGARQGVSRWRTGWAAPALSGAAAAVIGIAVVVSGTPGTLPGGGSGGAVPDSAVNPSASMTVGKRSTPAPTAVQAPSAADVSAPGLTATQPSAPGPAASSGPSDLAAPEAIGGDGPVVPDVVLRSSAGPWPSASMVTVMRRVRRVRGVLTTATVSARRGGGDRLLMEVWAPRGRARALRASLRAAAPAAGWTGAAGPGRSVGKALLRRFGSPERDWRALDTGGGAVRVLVGVVRSGR